MTQNMTQGKPLKLIVLFSIPMLIGNLFQQLYNMADTFIVGRTIGVNALAAVGSTGSITFLIIGFAFGVATGMAIVTAQRFGANDMQGVRRSFAVSLVLTVAISAVLTVISLVFARQILTLMQTPAEIIDEAYSYLLIIFAGIVVTMLFNVLSSFMRAVGNSKSPLVFLVLACVLNIVLDYAFIVYLNMGVAGAAYATILAQAVAVVACFVVIMRSPFRLTAEDFRFAAKDISQHLRIGLPMGFQSSIIAIGTIAVQFALNTLGTNAVAAFTAAGKIDSIANMPLMTFGSAMATYVAQNYGAGKYDRIRQGVKQCTVLSVAVAVALGGMNLLFGARLAQFFLGISGEVVEMASIYLGINGFCYFILAVLYVYRYTLQGLGNSAVPTFAGVMELIMRSFAAIVLGGLLGFTGVCLAGPLAWLGSAVPLCIAYYTTVRRRLAREQAVAAEPCMCACQGGEG